jgi:hypothetical protein
MVTFAGPAAARAARVLALPPRATRRMYLCERYGGLAGVPRLPLLDAGVEIHLRETDIGEQSMVVLRPCRRSRLTLHWLACHAVEGDGLRIEAEWAGERTTLAARLTSTRPAGTIDGLLVGRRFTHSPLSPAQQTFLADCADIPIDPVDLRLLGPVRIERWQPLPWRGLVLAVERWTVEHPRRNRLRLLEATLCVEPQAARIRQLGFETLLRRQGLEHGHVEQPAIRRTLCHLIDAEEPE